jgi:uncharacterized coiled-coil protein SlyX
MSSPRVLVFNTENNPPNDPMDIATRDEMDIILDTTLRESDKYEDVVTMETFDVFLTKLNEKLSMYGLPSPVILHPHPSNIIVLDCMNKMILQRERDAEQVENQYYETRKLKSDGDVTANNLRQLEKKYNQTLCELENVRQRSRDELSKERTNREKVTKERDNFATKLREIKSKNGQYGLKLAQTERQLDTMKERLTKVMNEKGMIKSNLVINNLPVKSNSSDDIMGQTIIKNLQEEKSELAFENFELRKTLKEINVRIETIRAQNEIEIKFEKLKDGMFDLPISMAKDEIKNNLEKRIQQIKDELDHRKSKSNLESYKRKIDQDFRDLIEDLEERVALQERTIEDQSKLLLYTMSELKGQSNYYSLLKEVTSNTPRKTPSKRKSEGKTLSTVLGSPVTPNAKRKQEL